MNEFLNILYYLKCCYICLWFEIFFFSLKIQVGFYSFSNFNSFRESYFIFFYQIFFSFRYLAKVNYPYTKCIPTPWEVVGEGHLVDTMIEEEVQHNYFKIYI